MTYYLVIAGTALFWVAQATSWNILSGYSGYFSFGQAAYVGVGAYTAAVLAGREGANFYLTMPLAGLLGGLLAFVVGAVAFRLSSLRGEIFALLTLAVPFILAGVARTSRTIDGGQGATIPVPSVDWIGGFQQLLFLLNLLVAALAVGCAVLLQRSRLGHGLTAIRDAEDAAEVLGVPTFRYKMIAIVISGTIGGIGGSVFALQIGFVTVESVFGLTIPLFVILMSVLGGRSHWLGPVIGAVLIVLLDDRVAAAGLDSWNSIILGAALAGLVIVAPDGLYGRLRARPLPALAAFVVLAGGLAVFWRRGDPLDWILVGLLGAAVVTIALGRLRPVAAVVRPVAVVEPSPPPPDPVPVVEDAEPLVRCEAVSRSFGGVRALDGVSVVVRPGEVVGLVGPNGSGKTTLVNLLCGAVRPSGGAIVVAGRTIGGMAPHLIAHAGVARTYQIPRPFASLTVRDNVATAIMFGRAPMSLAAARLSAARHLETVRLGHLADVMPAALNLHQRQLLEMARAIAAEPTVLLLDEAFAGLNPVEIDDAVAVIRRIHASGVAIIIVEHLLRVLHHLVTRIVVLDRGTVIADGEPRAVLADPVVVQAYLGRQGRQRA
jgi:branched-chain amino acid transport system permease protein